MSDWTWCMKRCMNDEWHEGGSNILKTLWQRSVCVCVRLGALLVDLKVQPLFWVPEWKMILPNFCSSLTSSLNKMNSEADALTAPLQRQGFTGNNANKESHIHWHQPVCPSQLWWVTVMQNANISLCCFKSVHLTNHGATLIMRQPQQMQRICASAQQDLVAFAGFHQWIIFHFREE